MKWDRSPGQSRWARLYLQQAELSSGSGTRAAVGGHLAGELLVSGRACLLVSPSFLAENGRLSVFLVDMVIKGKWISTCFPISGHSIPTAVLMQCLPWGREPGGPVHIQGNIVCFCCCQH